MDLKTLRFEYFEKIKISIFDHFLTFFEKTKKKTFFQKNGKMQDFLFSMCDIGAKNGQNFTLFDFQIVLWSQPQRQKFLWSYQGNSKNKLQIPEKNPVFRFSRPR